MAQGLLGIGVTNFCPTLLPTQSAQRPSENEGREIQRVGAGIQTYSKTASKQTIKGNLESGVSVLRSGGRNRFFSGVSCPRALVPFWSVILLCVSRTLELNQITMSELSIVLGECTQSPRFTKFSQIQSSRKEIQQ